MSIVKLARPEIQSLHAYRAAEQVDDTIRLNANESPVPTTATGFRRPLNRYPEVRPRRLRHSLAARFGCAPEQLLVTRGSSEAIDLLVRTFCRAGKDSILTTSVQALCRSSGREHHRSRSEGRAGLCHRYRCSDSRM